MPDPEESPNALVSVQELRDHMSGATLRTDQARDAAVTLIGLQRGLERYCNRRFTAGDVASERTFTDTDGYAMLRRTPVTSVASVTLDDGTALAVGSWTARRNGIVVIYPSTWLRVAYNGGYVPLDDDDLEDVRLAILDKARDRMTDNHDDTVSTKGLDVREPPARRPAADRPTWSDDELKRFDRLRRRVIL